MRLQCGGIPNADVLAKFRIDENGLYYNERIEQERERRSKHSAKQRENALKRWNKDNSTIKQTLSNGNAMAMPLETETETVNEVENVTEIYPGFEDFWILYDKKKGSKKIVQKKWQKLSYKTKVKIMDYLPAYIESTPDKVYRKNPDTFFNQEGWNDEIIYKTNNNGTTQKITERYSNLKQSILEDLQSS